MEYPTIEEVAVANHFKVLQWWRFLESPINDKEREVVDLLVVRIRDEHIINPMLSKMVGWDD